MVTSDHLNRFTAAQASVFDRVCAELERGRKTSHWMWFIFPQIAGLGHSEMSQRYAISGLAEAAAYLAHPILGPRLVQCCRLVLAIDNRSAEEILGSIDAVKFRSCLTLFSHAAGADPIFKAALQKYFNGDEDKATLDRLQPY
ncbi:MAG TPA: DUF1810 domain-containing protein [Dongiaceae bacterium]